MDKFGQILRPTARPYNGAVGSGLLVVRDIALPHETWFPGISKQTWIQSEHLTALQTVQKLIHGLLEFWEEIPLDTVPKCRNYISLWFQSLTLIFGVTLNPPPKCVCQKRFFSNLNIAFIHIQCVIKVFPLQKRK